MVSTFGSFLTPAGIVAAAALVTGFIEILKAAFPLVDERVSGAALAFIVTAVLFILTAVFTGVSTPDAGLAVFAAWLTCASSSIGIKASFNHLQSRVPGDWGS